jgi:hypothetical protein
MGNKLVKLLDHFHPPLKGERRWESFHSSWANYIAENLNRLLPADYFAEPVAHFGIEIDVATFAGSLHTTRPRLLRETAPAPYRVATVEDNPNDYVESTWRPTPPLHSFPVESLGDSVEVLIYEEKQGPILVGAIELISPANKDRPIQRQAFVSKCETLLRQGVGLIVVDIVTERKINLHNALMARMDAPPTTRLAATLYATAYTLAERNQQPVLELWLETLTVGGELPTLPLWLRGEQSIPVDLAATYTKTCHASRISRMISEI